MVLEYLRIPIDYSRLLRLLQVKNIGAPFRNLHNLQSLGVTVHLQEGNMEVLQEHLVAGLPIIVFVDTGFLTSYWREQTDHAVLVVGSDERGISQ
jgi:hypothetical protein